MFRCIKAPSEPQFSTDLDTFGYRKNENNEFIHKDTGEHFNFFSTDNERVNDSRRGAFQEGLRKAIAAELRDKHSIHEVFLSGEDGTQLTTSRPTEANVSLLVTTLDELTTKRDVIVIVGEGTQDCGIWAWRIAQRHGGIDGGTLTGLAKKMREIAGESPKGCVAGLSLGEGTRSDADKSETPGIVVLNPGQLLYSHELGRNLTFASWQSRPRPTAITGPYKIEPKHNWVPGHENPHRHVDLVFRRVLPQITAHGARLHILAIGDGTTATVDTVDKLLQNHNKLELHGRYLESTALIEPKHEHDKIQSRLVKTFLATTGKAWVQSEQPKGTQLQMPEVDLLSMPALQYAPGAAVTSPDQGEAQTDVNITRDASATTLRAEGHNDQADETTCDASSIASQDYHTIPAVPNNTPADSGTTSPAVLPSTTTSPVKVVEEGTPKADYREDEDDEYPAPPPLPVSCSTFSAGVCDGVTETVFPAVIDDSLGHLWLCIQKAKERDVKEAVREGEKGVAWPRDGGDN